MGSINKKIAMSLFLILFLNVLLQAQTEYIQGSYTTFDKNGASVTFSIAYKPVVFGGIYLEMQLSNFVVESYRYNGVTYNGSNLAEYGIQFPIKMNDAAYVIIDGIAALNYNYNSGYNGSGNFNATIHIKANTNTAIALSPMPADEKKKIEIADAWKKLGKIKSFTTKSIAIGVLGSDIQAAIKKKLADEKNAELEKKRKQEEAERLKAEELKKKQEEKERMLTDEQNKNQNADKTLIENKATNPDKNAKPNTQNKSGQGEDDFWSGNTSTNDKKTTEKNDDFWSGNTTADNKKTADNPDDFWTGNRGKDETIGTVTDIDGNVYKTVTIGTQVWMAENLKTTHFNDGTRIPNVAGVTTEWYTEWYNLESPAFCWYNNDRATYGNTYGALYNWYTLETGRLCPIGWHVPSDEEWEQLIDYLGGENVAGGKLKETGTTHWKSPNLGATNETGFTALPSGNRNFRGSFHSIGTSCGWWSANCTEKFFRINYDGSYLYRDGSMKQGGFSVRCVNN